MIRFILPITFLFLSACGTTSKKLVNLPPLAPTARVQAFWSRPNIKYQEVCTIEARGNNSLGSSYTEKEDFKKMFEDEARKCGADGFIFGFMSGYRDGGVTATATGIKIQGPAAGLVSEDTISAFSIAIQTRNVTKVRQILKAVPKKQAERAPTDDELVNSGLYLATLEGLTCDAPIVDLLEKEYQGRIPKFKAVNFSSANFSSEKSDFRSPLCRDVAARSLSRMVDTTTAVIEVNNHYVTLLNNRTDAQFEKEVGAYNQLLISAAKVIVEGCKKSATDPACAVKAGYLDFANNTKTERSPALKKNAKDILKILGQ